MTSNAVTVSVVVPVRASSRVDVARLGRCLDALAEQRIDPGAYEVVVVDDGSVLDLAGAAGNRTGVVLRRIRAAGSYAARNEGLRLAQGRVVAFTDADCVPEPDWLPRALAVITADPTLGAVAGAVEVPVTTRSGAWARYDALTAFPQRRFVERFGFGATANLVVRREVFDDVGKFDCALTSGGDAEWGARAARAGHRIGYAPEIRVRHLPRSTVRAVLSKALRTTRGVERLAARRGAAEPLHRAVLDRLGRPWRERSELLADPRSGGPWQRARVFAVAVTHAVVVAADTVRTRTVLAAGPMVRDRFARLAGDPGDLRRLAGAAVLVAAADALLAARGTASPGGFGDGAAYRRMARGEPGAAPFHRRILVPWLVRTLTGGDGLAGFRAVALIGVGVGAAGTGCLTARVARECGAPPPRARQAGLLAGALVPVMPHSTRMAVQMPPFNDQFAAGLGAVWLLLAGAERRSARRLAPVAALLATLTREQWALVTAVVSPALSTRGRREWLVHLVAAVAALALVLRHPAGPGSEVYPPEVAARRFVTRSGLAELAWGVGSVLGPLPVLLPVARRRAPGSARDGSTLPALLRVATIQLGLALVGGSDTPRLVHGALPFLVAATVGVTAADTDRRLVPVVAGTLALWRPGVRPEASETGYELFHLPYMHHALARRAAASALRVLTVTALVGRRHRCSVTALERTEASSAAPQPPPPG